MTNQRIETLYFVDDSDDEAFLSNVFFESQNIDLAIEHHTRFDSFLDEALTLGSGEIACCLAVIDLNLTVSKGTDGIRQMRQANRLQKMVVGICTGSEDPADRRNAEESGADFFVAKPLNLESLEAICRQVPALKLLTTGTGAIQLWR